MTASGATRSTLRTALGRTARAARLRTLGLLYARGQRRTSAVEPADQSIVALGQSLRAQCLTDYSQRFAGSAWRILLCTPPSIAAEVWFSDLASGMQHAGITCRQLAPLTPANAALLADFRPNVVIALDGERALEAIDLPALREWKERHGCLRLFVPTRDALLEWRPTLSPREEQRLQLAASGGSADAFVSLYEPDFFPLAHQPWVDAGFSYVSLPQSGNPLEDYPRDVQRTHDYFYASVATPERLKATWRGLRPILWGHHGDWAGEGWGFGGDAIDFSAMPTRYGAARVALSPLLPSLRTHPLELTHRVFEAAACGAFQITSSSPVTRRFFSEDALLCARDDRDFVELVRRYVVDPEARSRFAIQALKELYAAHTVFHRIVALLSAMEELSARLA